MPVEDYSSYTYSNGFHRPVPEKTYDRIFNEEKKLKAFNEENAKRAERPRNNKCYQDHVGGIFENLGKNTNMQKVTGKPCNGNFNELSSQAKKNFAERYYFDNNANQW